MYIIISFFIDMYNSANIKGSIRFTFSLSLYIANKTPVKKHDCNGYISALIVEPIGGLDIKTGEKNNQQ